MSPATQEQQSSTSLASRPSFFGGFVSTRKESALATWKPTLPSQLQSGQSNKVKASSASRGKPSNQVKAAPAPPSDPALLRKQQLKTNRNFDSDSDTEGDRPKPRAYNQQLAQLDQHLNAAEKAAAAKLPGLKPQHASQHLQQQQQNVYKSPYANVTSKAASAVRTVAPKGKAGAGSRNMALAPQAIGLSRKQMADRGIRQAVDSVRAQGPAPPLHPSSSQPHPSSSNTPQSSSNRGPSSMPSTSGRSMHPSAASLPQHPSRVGGPASQRSSSAAPRHMVQGMPAWMQKAKQAAVAANAVRKLVQQSPPAAAAAASISSLPVQPGLSSQYGAVLAGRGAKRMRPDNDEYVDDDFVVDDEEEPDWRQALKSVTRYDPSKFDDRGFDDRSMEANYKQIQAEERRSARMGRDDDRRAEEEEIKLQEEKRQKKKRAKSNNGMVL